MKRTILSIVIATVLGCNMVYAQSSYTVELEMENCDMAKKEISYNFATIEFSIDPAEQQTAKVNIRVRNLTDEYLLLFKETTDKKGLKKAFTTKTVFDKKYGSYDTEKKAEGCNAGNNFKNMQITPKDSDSFQYTAEIDKEKTIELNFYVAKNIETSFLWWHTKRLVIIEKKTAKITLKVNRWSTNNPDYLKYSKLVEELLGSINNPKFCGNPKHDPSFDVQIEEYKTKIDSLGQKIYSFVTNTKKYTSDGDERYDAYMNLRKGLNKVDWENYKKQDCGKHKRPGPNHSCEHCSKEAKDIRGAMRDLYEELGGHKISPERAKRTAKSLYECFNTKKASDKQPYNDAIQEYYRRIKDFK